LNLPQNLSRSRPTRILAGDIGGTFSRLAIYRHQASHFELLRMETFSSPEHDCLSDVLATFLEKDCQGVDVACFGLPAPIHSGVVFPLTNLHWLVDREQVLRTVGTDRVALINDVEASAAGIQGLSEDDLVCLQSGQVDPAGNRVVIAVGTGLGVSALTPSGHTVPTEAGHASFSPRSDLDLDLYAKLKLEYGHVSWERVASGSALPYIHALLAPAQSSRLEPVEIVRRSGSDPVCKLAVDTLRHYIGAAAGNIALTLMASGGLYLAGGVAEKVLDQGNSGPFIDAFCDKGRMRALLERMPVFLVRESDIALRGAAQRAIALFNP
jgi:glucokinase